MKSRLTICVGVALLWPGYPPQASAQAIQSYDTEYLRTQQQVPNLNTQGPTVPMQAGSAASLTASGQGAGSGSGAGPQPPAAQDQLTPDDAAITLKSKR